MATYSGDSCHLSELRIVLLGGNAAGKSSVGNTILGRDEFDLERASQCVKRQGEVAGRQVTVVDTPGWWANLSIERTPEVRKHEIARSVSLCPPGPHSLLLVIRASGSFTEQRRKSVEKHLELLTERVWSHTIVLFTHGDSLGDKTIEQHIESEEKALQWLVEKCGNRYHVLNNKNRGDGSQVTELLEKIEMVARNRGGHYDIKTEILERIERWTAIEERAKQRLMKLQEQRESLRSLMGDSLHHSELRIVLLGYRVAGKSSAGNTILGRGKFDPGRTAQCVKRQGEVAGRQVTVVDTPGWWADVSLENSHGLIKQEIVRSVSLCPPEPHTLLLVIRVIESINEQRRKSIEEHVNLLSQIVWNHTIVLFTWGECLGDKTIEQHIESEGKALQWLVEKCGNRYHVLSNDNSGDGTQVTELLEKIEEMVAGNRGSHYEMKREILEKVELSSRRKEAKAKQRQVKVMEQREIHKTFIGESLDLSELRIVLLGWSHAGKSTAGNTILGRGKFDLGSTATQCVKRQGEVAGRKVTMVYTPGWSWKATEENSPELVKDEIVRSVSLCPPGPHTLLLVIRVGVSFTEENRKSVEEHMGLLSEIVWSHTIVLFTYGDYLGDTTIEQYIESEGKTLQWLVEKCGYRYHVFNHENRVDGTQVTELLEKIEEMVAGNSGDYFKKPSLPIRGARSITSTSGDSKPETGFYSDLISEAGSLLWSDGTGLEEMWKKPSLPIRGARSILPPPSMSGDSRPETGYDGQMSEDGSVAESLLKPDGTGLEEMWKKPSLPIRGARSILPPPSMSGDSRPETGFGSEQMSEDGSVADPLLKPERRMRDFHSEDPNVLQQ